jgi:hypothetical protein
MKLLMNLKRFINRKPASGHAGQLAVMPLRDQANGAFSTRSQMPQGQAPAQNPQPMQRSAATTYS